MNKGKVTGAIFLDFFDSVNHKILLQTLNSHGITGKALKWFKSFLENRSQTLKCNLITQLLEI